MKDKKLDKNIVSESGGIKGKILELKRKKEKILSLPAENALEEIINSENPYPLVHSLKEEELHILINEIGAEDSLPLMSMASSKQLDYIFDIEIWEKDRIDIPAAVKWLMRLFQADSRRLMKWIFVEDPDEKIPFLEFMLNKNINLIIREHDQDPSDFGDDFFTLDDLFYIKIKNSFPFDNLIKKNDPEIPKEDDVAYTGDKEITPDFFYFFLKKIAEYDFEIFKNILISQSGVLPAEYEEEALRFKNTRLAEKGFAPYEVAIGVYAGLTDESFKKMPQKSVIKNDKNPLPVPVFYTEFLETDNLFIKTLKLMDAAEKASLQSEFASLCNYIISADRSVIRSRTDLKTIAMKVSYYLSIGLEKASATEPCENIVRKYFLKNIFRLGTRSIFEIKWKAERFQKNSWFIKNGLPIIFWDEIFTGILGGVLLEKPLFFDNYETSNKLYREFKNLQDVKFIDNKIDKMIAFDSLFKDLKLTANIDAAGELNTIVTYKNFFLTLWAKSFLEENFYKPEKLKPLTTPELTRFFKKFFLEDSDKKAALLLWCESCSGLAAHEISAKYGNILEELFSEIEKEYAEIVIDEINARYITLFLTEEFSE